MWQKWSRNQTQVGPQIRAPPNRDLAAGQGHLPHWGHGPQLEIRVLDLVTLGCEHVLSTNCCGWHGGGHGGGHSGRHSGGHGGGHGGDWTTKMQSEHTLGCGGGCWTWTTCTTGGSGSGSFTVMTWMTSGGGGSCTCSCTMMLDTRGGGGGGHS